MKKNELFSRNIFNPFNDKVLSEDETEKLKIIMIQRYTDLLNKSKSIDEQKSINNIICVNEIIRKQFSNKKYQCRYSKPKYTLKKGSHNFFINHMTTHDLFNVVEHSLEYPVIITDDHTVNGVYILVYDTKYNKRNNIDTTDKNYNIVVYKKIKPEKLNKNVYNDLNHYYKDNKNEKRIYYRKINDRVNEIIEYIKNNNINYYGFILHKNNTLSIKKIFFENNKDILLSSFGRYIMDENGDITMIINIDTLNMNILTKINNTSIFNYSNNYNQSITSDITSNHDIKLRDIIFFKCNNQFYIKNIIDNEVHFPDLKNVLNEFKINNESNQHTPTKVFFTFSFPNYFNITILIDIFNIDTTQLKKMITEHSDNSLGKLLITLKCGEIKKRNIEMFVEVFTFDNNCIEIYFDYNNMTGSALALMNFILNVLASKRISIEINLSLLSSKHVLTKNYQDTKTFINIVTKNFPSINSIPTYSIDKSTINKRNKNYYESVYKSQIKT